MISTLGVKSIFCFNDISEYCIVEQKICGMETTKLNTMRNYLHLIAVAFILLFVSTSFIGVGAPLEEDMLFENSNYRTENFRISTNGKIEFNDDYTDVTDMEEGAFLQISMSSFGIKRKILISKYHNKINRQYYEGYKELKFDPKGREWLAKVLPSVVRDSGMDMENRVNRIYKKGGISAFLKDLEQTPNDYYRSRMVEFLLKNNDLKKSELQKLIREFPYRINSDRELSQIYRQYNPVFLRYDDVSEEFFNSLAEIESNHELAQILKSVYESNELNKQNFIYYTDAIDALPSGYERSNMMRFTLKDRKLTKEQMEVLLARAEKMASEYDKIQIVNTLIADEGLSSANVDKIIELVRTISTQYEVIKIPYALIREKKLNSGNLEAFIELIQEMNMQHNYGGILSMLVQYEGLGKNKYDVLLKASDHITSSFEFSKFFVDILTTGELNKKQQLKLLQKSVNYPSDYELSGLLMLAIRTMDMEDDQIKEAITEAAQEINSEYEYGKVMKAIYSYGKKPKR